MKRSIILAAVANMARHIKLEEGDTPGRVRFLSQAVSLAAGASQTWVTLTRTGDFSDPRYGKFSITTDMLGQMVRNFDTRVLGQDVFIDVSHKPSDGAAGKVLKLSVENGRLRALVEWTPFGVEAIKSRGFTYLSAEYHEAWKPNEQTSEKQQPYGCVLLGAGLTVRPVIKHLEPVQLSEHDEDGAVRIAISPSLLKELSEHSMNYLDQLRAKYKALGLSEEVSAKLLAEAKKQFDEAASDAVRCLALLTTWETAGQSVCDQLKALGQGNPQTVSITLATPALDVNAAVQKALSDRDAADAAATTAYAGKLKLLSETIAAGDPTLTAEGVKKFADDYAPMVTALSTDDQVKHLAGLAVKQAQELGAARKLAGLGYNAPGGQVHISVESSNSIKSLQQTMDTRFGLTDKADPKGDRFCHTGNVLLDGNRKFAEKALAMYDAMNGQVLDAEHRALAAGTGTVSDTKVPAIVERTVLREVLYNLNSLEVMDLGTAPFASVITVPYSYRDTTAAGINGLRRFENQAVRRAGVIQTSEDTRPIPQKLSFRISSEMSMLFGNSVIDWDPIAENVRNISRMVSEDTEAINFNEIVNASDEYAVAAGNDTLTATVNGTNKVFVTANFPVVKPRKAFDLQGVQQGATLNPIVVTLNSIARSEYVLPADGSALAAGTYYVMDYNLGEIRFVTETGAAVVPTNAWPLTVTYSYSTNAAKFNTDLGALTTGQLYDNLLVSIGTRKVVVGTDRFFNPDMVLMSNSIDNALTQATTFTANGARTGSSLAADGSVGMTKGMATFNPKAPGLQLADTRIVVGQRRNSRFRMVKPFSMNPIEQARDASGNFIDAKESFGTQYVASMTPLFLKAATSSIILYSSTNRVARA